METNLSKLCFIYHHWQPDNLQLRLLAMEWFLPAVTDNDVWIGCETDSTKFSLVDIRTSF